VSRFALLIVAPLAALLGGCATGLKPPETAPQTATQGATPGAAQRGAYYKDDGPGANPPAGLANLPDAVPKDEALHRYANRPYQVFGREYTPFTEARPYRERGVASWYGRRFNGQRTSSGESYDMYSMSAAHPLLPIPSYARVTNLANGRSVVVRVNDRGPFHNGRLIDLSYAAAYKLGFAEAGSAQVEVESILPGGALPANAQLASAQPTAPLAESAPAPVAAAPGALTGAVPVENVGQPGVYLQLGAFASRENAESFRLRVYRELAWLADPIHVVNAGKLYKVHLGPYRSRAEAKPVATRIGSELDFTPMMLVR
jgi:rare lipoprotein A